MKITIGDLRKQIEGLDDNLELIVLVCNHIDKKNIEIVYGENIYFRLAKVTANSQPLCFVINCDVNRI